MDHTVSVPFRYSMCSVSSSGLCGKTDSIKRLIFFKEQQILFGETAFVLSEFGFELANY